MKRTILLLTLTCLLAGGFALRAGEPPVIARVADSRLLLDVRCLGDEDLESVAAVLAGVV